MTDIVVTLGRGFVNPKPVLSGCPHVSVPLTVASTRSWPAVRLALNASMRSFITFLGQKNRFLRIGFRTNLDHHA
jgi:hypothetical protein